MTLLCAVALLATGSGPHPGLAIAGGALNSASLQVLSPTAGATVENGSLVLVEIETGSPLDGTTSWVEVSTGDPNAWQPARLVPNQPLRWRFIWTDPVPGQQTLRIRAVGLAQSGLVETSLRLNVDPQGMAAAGIRDPYATGGRFYKGQLHDHSTWSFEGWTAMPPKQWAEEYRRIGYDWLAITDHNVVANPSELNSDSFAVIPGFESTHESGHIVGLFMDIPLRLQLSAPGANRCDQCSRGTIDPGAPRLDRRLVQYSDQRPAGLCGHGDLQRRDQRQRGARPEKPGQMARAAETERAGSAGVGRSGG